MLTLVHASDTEQDVQARLAAQALTVTEIAAAPVRYLPTVFLAAVAGLFPELLKPDLDGLAAL